jgi:tetratricopeptide (TPR) repeat protein
MRVAAACVLVSAVVALGPAASGRVEPQTAGAESRRIRAVSTREILDRYLKGDYDGALRSQPPLTRFVFADADRWVTAGGAAAVERRSMAAALFALEYSESRPALLAAMLTWGRELLARQPPRPAEADWLRAAIVVAQGQDRWRFLLDGVAGPAAHRRRAAAPVGHIRFARLRYPDDPYFQMAEATGAELLASRPIDRLSAPLPETPMGWDRISTDFVDAARAGLSDRAAALARAAGLLERLVDHDALGAEANLRLGYIRLREGQSDAALAHFDRVASLTGDARLRYLAHLYSGWTLGTKGRIDEAIVAYRAAARFVPQSQSASALLVALLTKHDRLADAEQVADEFLSADEAAGDPWRAYFVGDSAAYPAIVRRLREGLR